MRNHLFILTLCLLIAGCGSKTREKSFDVALEEPAKPNLSQVKFAPPVVKNDEESSEGSTQVADTSKKIIKEGEISFETGSIKNTRKALADSLQRLGGYIDEENETNNSDVNRKDYTLKIRVPARNFDKMLSAISSTADRIESKSIRIKDVTTEYIDITTRLNNKHLLENRYKELLQKAIKMSDVLEVEDKLTEIRTDIETTQGQLNYLNKQIAFSSLDITFFTQSVQSGGDGNGFGYQLKSALISGWQTMQGIFFGLISLWPVVIIIVALFYLYRAWRRKRRARAGA